MGIRRYYRFFKAAIVPAIFAAIVCPLTIFGQQTDGSGPILPVQAGQPPQKKDGTQAGTEEPTLEVPTIGGAGKPLPGIQTSAKPAESSVTTAPQSTSVDDALRSSINAGGVETQRRSAFSYDPRVRGYHFGQLVTYADGSNWLPVRVDLDTALGKINPDWVRDINVIKGPYSVRYGPGFAFLDVETLPPERYKDGFEAHGSTSLGYKTNGSGWTGRQYLWGGNCNWGFRLGYSVLAGNDYREGGGDTLPTSYDSHNVDFAFGFDLSDRSRLEIKYLRQMQNDTEYPGLLTDVNQMNTDGFAARYVFEKAPWFDRLTLDGWYNTTHFNGDSLHPGKHNQIPQLGTFNSRLGIIDNGILIPGQITQFRLDLNTEGDLYTWGVRQALTWGEDKGVNVTLGADFALVRQAYDEFDAFNFSLPSNLGIPASRSIDPGIFVDGALPMGERLQLRAGARVDFVETKLLHLNNLMDPAFYLETTGEGTDPFADRHFTLFSAYVTSEYKLSDEVTLSAGYGYAERPPSLTELYTGGAFLGLIQSGLNSIYGDPALREEKLNQFDIGARANFERFRGGAHGFFAWVEDYITYQPRPFGNDTFTLRDVQVPVDEKNSAFVVVNLHTILKELRFKNTSRASLIGFEVAGEYDLLPWLTPFATASYVNGRDLGIHEPLPGISPLEGRTGIRLHDPDKKNPRWGLEFLARLVALQDEFAASLGEMRTPGFAIFDLRGYWQPRDRLLFTAGVENIGDRLYQEHLDLRTGRGVFQPGVNFYAGMRVSY